MLGDELRAGRQTRQRRAIQRIGSGRLEKGLV
jgi:hypothetical protein